MTTTPITINPDARTADLDAESAHLAVVYELTSLLRLAHSIRDEARVASNRDLEARRAMQRELQLAEGRLVMMQLRAESAEERLEEYRRNTFADTPERVAEREALPQAERDAALAKERKTNQPPTACGAAPAARAPTPVPNPAPDRAAAYLLGWILWNPDGVGGELVSLGIYSEDEISLTYNHDKGFYVRLLSATGDTPQAARAALLAYLAAGPLSRLLPKLKGYTPPAPPSTLETVAP